MRSSPYNGIVISSAIDVLAPEARAISKPVVEKLLPAAICGCEFGTRAPRPDPWRRSGRARCGMSMYESAEAAREISRGSPWHGTYVAVIEIPADAYVRAKQTGRNRAHYAVWASPGDLLAWVVSVAPVEAVH